MTNPIIPIELVEQVARKNCVLFLGWSYSDPKPGILTDKVLSKKLSERIGFSDTTKTLDEVAEFFEVQRGPVALRQFACDVIESFESPPAFYKDLLQLPFNIIVSTSLDTYVKRILQDLGIKFNYVMRDEEITFIEEEKDTRIVVKLYGDIDNRSSMVLTKENLIGFFDKFPSISDLLKYYFNTKTLVFIGYNLDDPHFSQLYAYTNQRTKGYQKRAFAIVPKADEYQKTVWGKKNLTILDTDIDSFLGELQKNINVYSPEHGISLSHSDIPAVRALKAPYKFLNSFDEDDSGIFFGREKEITQTTHKLLSNKLIILYGKSGYGKTSLIKAGIIPLLLANSYLPIYARCSSDPLVSIKSGLLDRLAKYKLSDEAVNFLNGKLNIPLKEFVVECGKWQSKRLVVILDQFEEFFISLGEETKIQFVRELADCVDSPLDITFVLSLREDFLPDLHDIKKLRSMVGDSYRLRALSLKSAQDAILKPAAQFNIQIEPEVVSAIIGELSDKGNVDPAQLQIVCDRLYNKLPETSKIIDEALYGDLGGVRQILSDYLDEILYDFGAKRMDVAHKILRSMVTSWFTRIPISYTEAVLYTSDIPDWNESETRELLSDLIKVRLIRRTVDTSEEAFELTHEYLIVKIREWIDLEQLRVKESLDLLRQELNNWLRHQIPMDKSKLAIIDSQRDRLVLDNRQKVFMLTAAIQQDFEFEYWLKRNDGNHLVIEQLLKLLDNDDPNVRNLAGLGLSINSRDESILDTVMRTFEFTANPNTIALINELGDQGFVFLNDFSQRVIRVVEKRFTKNMSHVPAGKFLAGTHKSSVENIIDGLEPDKKPPISFFDGQYPQREIEIADFYIDKYMVTNSEYKEFKKDHRFDLGKENHPAVGVSYFDALAYAQWLGKDLPTEYEWEKASRGLDGRDFPWGNEWMPKNCNTSISGYEGTTPVGNFPDGISPYGCFDMSGNVWEWTSTAETNGHMVLRGGSWSRYGILPWCWYRFSYKPDQGYPNVGFRCIKRK